MEWISGPRCGVDNCPSTLYTVINGLTQCQNGHIQHGVEFGEDDDVDRFGSQMHRRRDKIVKLDFKESHLIVGAEYERLHRKGLAAIFRTQVDIVAKTFNLPWQFQEEARRMWFLFSRNKYYWDSPIFVTVSQTPQVLCIVLRRFKLPVYNVDIMRMFRSGTLPYLVANSLPEIRKLPIDSQPFEPTPINIYTKSVSPGIPQYFMKLGVEFYKPPIEPLYFKMLSDLMLPPTLYSPARRVAEIVAQERKKDATQRSARGDIWFRHIFQAEREVLWSIFIALKLTYSFDGIPRSDNKWSRDHPDWGSWTDILLKFWLEQNTFISLDDREAINWDKETADKFLAFFNVIMHKPKPPPEMKQRVLDMFPLPDEASPFDTYDPEVHLELFELLNSIPPSQVDDTPEPYGEPGACYQSYSSDPNAAWNIPSQLEDIYKLGASFSNMTETDFTSGLSSYEKMCKRPVLNWMYPQLVRVGEVASKENTLQPKIFEGQEIGAMTKPLPDQEI